jgi:hypothetical protein
MKTCGESLRLPERQNIEPSEANGVFADSDSVRPLPGLLRCLALSLLLDPGAAALD